MQQTKDVSEKLQNIILNDLATNKELSPGNLNASLGAVLDISRVVLFAVQDGTDDAQVIIVSKNSEIILKIVVSDSFCNHVLSWLLPKTLYYYLTL